VERYKCLKFGKRTNSGKRTYFGKCTYFENRTLLLTFVFWKAYMNEYDTVEMITVTTRENVVAFVAIVS